MDVVRQISISPCFIFSDSKNLLFYYLHTKKPHSPSSVCCCDPDLVPVLDPSDEAGLPGGVHPTAPPSALSETTAGQEEHGVVRVIRLFSLVQRRNVSPDCIYCIYYPFVYHVYQCLVLYYKKKINILGFYFLKFNFRSITNSCSRPAIYMGLTET